MITPVYSPELSSPIRLSLLLAEDLSSCVMEAESFDRDVRRDLSHIAFKPRAYQLEMLDISLRRNLIVAMPTGSGKTLIAVMRAREALEHCKEGQLVWFCAPKVELARQQYKYASTQLAMFKTRLLIGEDSCEFWSQQIWDEILADTRIVVSTYAVKTIFSIVCP